METEKNILDHLGVVVRWRRMIVLSVLSVSLVAAGISLILPEAFTARAVIYPPKESQGMFGLSALLESLPMGLLGMEGGSVAATDFVPVLQSERIAMAIADRFGLEERYKPEHREELLGMISERLNVELSREQFLSVTYEDETPQLAADITNAFVDELDRALQERRREQNTSLREYLSERLSETEANMLSSERAYNRFQAQHMAIDLETQAKAQIESASSLINTLAEKIIEREVAGKMMEAGNPKLQQLDLEIQAADEALDALLMGGSGSDGPPGGKPGAGSEFPEIFIPFREIPALGLEALQLMRDMEIQNVMYKFIFQEHEKARLEEEKATPLVISLDRAVPPDSRSRPRRTMMVALAGGLSTMLSVLLAFLLEALGNMEGENRRKLDAILHDLGMRKQQ